MEISDIQLEGSQTAGNIIITFCSTENWDDIMFLKIDVSEAWKISQFCKERLSYGAQMKNSKT